MKNILLLTLAAAITILIGCSDSTEEPEVDCTQSDLAVTISDQTKPDCETAGSIVVTGSGGMAPYMYSINGGTTFQNEATFSDVAAGDYTITIQDNDGCTATVNTTLLAGENGITLTLSSTDAECGNDIGTISASAVGGDQNYTFSLDGEAPQTSGEFANVSNGSHEVEVTDGTGCSATKSITVSSGVSWASEILPIINSNCAVSGCHNGDNSSIPNWTIFSNVQMQAADIKFRTGDRTMPEAGSGLTLTDAQIELIACWVDDGANNN